MLSEEEIKQIRSFNRQYVIKLGILNKPNYATNLSWAERRIMIEIGVNHLTTPMSISKKLNLDKSYTSRLINHLVKKGLVIKTPSPKDSRSVELSMTDEGIKTFNAINTESNHQVEEMIAKLSENDQQKFFECIKTAKNLLFK